MKDLTILLNNRTLADIVIVDNKIESYASNLENGIPITDYLGQDHDEMLIILKKYLLKFKDRNDVRQLILRDFYLEHLQEMRCGKEKGKDGGDSCMAGEDELGVGGSSDEHEF